MPSSSQLAQRDAMETTLSLCVSLLEELDCARSLSVRILLRYEQWDQIAEGLPIDASWFENAHDFFKAYQATKLLTKADFLPTTFDRRKVALERFESAESQCSSTNSRWRSVYGGPSLGEKYPGPGIDRIISMTKSRIHRILGRFPAERLGESCRWGPGATTSIRNPRTSVYEKYLEPVTGSGLCFTLFSPLLEEITLWSSFQRGYRCVSDGNKVVLVPKNAKTERSIASEPSFDSYIQLGIGRLMRERLALHGVNLKSQETNQDLARYGSLTGKVATMDLSMASDTASKTVIEHQFPADWLVAMKACRSPHWRLGRDRGVYSKFSSMGNGYTFEMETILFYATAMSVAEVLGLPTWEVTVFGDDITIGVEGVKLLSDALAFQGFTVNASKSHDSGVFRESCGKDYFLGTNVRPYFVESVLRDVRDLIKFHNGILRGLIPSHRTAAKALRMVRAGDRLFGPSLLGDTVFWAPAPRGKFRLASTVYPMFEGFIVSHWVFKPEKKPVVFFEPAVLASIYALGQPFREDEPYLACESNPTRGMSTLRKRGTWSTRTVVIPGWDDGGL